VTLIMGVLNVTPDSFSDGGLWFESDAAIEHALDLVDQGADIIDVGGESTRPGAVRVDPLEEQARVVPVIRALATRGITVSVDTMNSSTARAAADVGAAIINDVSGGLADPAMPQAVLDTELQYVVMHWRGQSDSMDTLATYTDTVAEVRSELSARLTDLVESGIDPPRPAPTTGRCSAISPPSRRSATPCSSAPPANASSALSCPTTLRPPIGMLPPP
jgi:dihydropteroate synthase